MQRSCRILISHALLTLVLSSLFAAPVIARSYVWMNPTGGRWDETANWNYPGYPQYLWDFAIFGVEGDYTVDATNAYAVQSVAGIMASGGQVEISTHAGFGAVLAVGITGTPASLTLCGGVVDAVGVHTVGAAGTLVLKPGSRLVSRAGDPYGFSVEAGGVLRGDQGTLDNHILRSFGTVSPGIAPGAGGVLTLGQNGPAGYIQRETGLLEIDLGGTVPGEHDQLQIVATRSPVLLDGTLTVALTDGFVPKPGDRFDIITAPELDGEFSEVTLPSVPDLEFSLVYEPTRISVLVSGEAVTELAARLDIQPGACPNPLNSKKKGVVPVALLGGDGFDVQDVDPASLVLEGVAPLRWSFEDISGPGNGDVCGCPTEGPDGREDLSLKFSAPQLIDALASLFQEEERTLTLTGSLYDGTPFTAADCILGKGNGPNNRRLVPISAPSSPIQTVSYQLPEEAEVRLGVFSVTGRKVAELVRSRQSAGDHRVSWNTGGAASGIYFYRLETPNGVETVKLVLLR